MRIRGGKEKRNGEKERMNARKRLCYLLIVVDFVVVGGGSGGADGV